jgi:KIX domain
MSSEHGSTSNNENNTTATATSNGDDWRLTVSQQYRNTEVREIAKVLAALEPGATSASKLMLAMRFEDTIFKAATSLIDYRKKLTKRLKRVQKSYVPTNTTAATNKEQLIKELRNNYGDAMRYISQHAGKAITELQMKHGPEKANQLQQHTDLALSWAQDLGLLSNTQPNFTMSEDQVQKLQQYLERRLDNIRSHVVRLADPDLFRLETLQKVEADMTSRASLYLADNTRKRFEQLTQGQHQQQHQQHQQQPSFDPSKLLVESMDKAQVVVPPPTRSQRNDEQAALLHLDKMRAAATAMLAFMALPDKTTAPRNILVQSHDVASQGLEFVGQVLQHRRNDTAKTNQQQQQQVESLLSLQDAWTKTIESPTLLSSTTSTILTTTTTDTELAEAVAEAAVVVKPIKQRRPAIRSRILLTKNRKTPSNLLPALLRKRAILVRPAPHGEGSHLILEFGKAFVMTIYLVPLVVTLRAYSKNHQETMEGRATGLTCASYTPIDDGLREMESLHLWGMEGTHDTMGHVIQARLEDASAQATSCLRRLFAMADKENAPEFEVEILEATALLEFLQNARHTFIPDWQDDE